MTHATTYFKGFDKDLKCRDFQFEVGKSYECDDARLCKAGFHACENPMDVLSYYPPCTSRYCEVALDDISDEREKDSKRCARKITVVREYSKREFFLACAEWMGGNAFEKSATGYSGHASATGNSGHASATGYFGHASATGYFGHASATGNSGHASATGNSGHASATGDSGHASAAGDSGHASAAGDYGHASATGNYGHASATGYFGHASATGNSGHAIARGKNSVAAAFGQLARAKAEGNCKFIVLSDWRDGELVDVKVGRVGENIDSGKEYQIIDGAFMEAK